MDISYTIEGQEYNFDVDVTWDDVQEYFDYYGGYLPNELMEFFDVDALSESEYFEVWMKDRYEYEAKQKFADEYADRLDDAVFDVYFQFSEDTDIDDEKFNQACVDAADEYSVSQKDVAKHAKEKLKI